MEDNRLDQFFRNKLDQANPDSYNPAHWAEAKKLLFKKKDRKSLYFLMFALFLLLSFGIVFLINVQDQEEPMQTQSPANLEMTIVPSSSNYDNQQIISEEKDLEEKTLAAGSKEALVIGNNDRKNNLDQSVTSNIRSLDLPRQSEMSYLELDNEATQAFEEEISENNPDMSISESENQRRVTHYFEELQALNPNLSYHYELQPKNNSALLHSDRMKRIRMGWASTLLLNPASKDVPVQGLTIGFAYERYFGEKWLYGTRPSLQMRGNEGGFSKFEQITSFGFSSVNTTYALKANTLQFISAPVYVAGEFGRHQLEAGFSIDVLLGARGQLQEVSVEDQVVSNLQNINSGWIDTGDMKKLSTNLFIGYKNAINHRLKTGITFFYNPVKIYPGLPNSQSQIINARWYLGWQATYYVK